MTPEEKAKELVNKFSNIPIGQTEDGEPYLLGEDTNQEAMECALICVDEIINVLSSGYDIDMTPVLEYWQDVKLEINKL